MKRTEAESVGDVLRRAIEDANMSQKLAETRACALWPRIVGPDIAARTSAPSVKNALMTVSVPNAALRHELLMTRSSIVKIINDTLNADVISDIRFIS